MTKIIKLKYYTELGYRVDLPGNQEGEYVPLEAYREVIEACKRVLHLIKNHQAYDKDAQSILEQAIAKAEVG